MKMLEALVYPCHTKKPEVIPLLCIEMIRRTLKKGVTPLTPYAFGFLGFVLTHFLGEIDGGKVYVRHAFALLEKYKFTDVEPRTRFMIYAVVVHWTEPLQGMMHSWIDVYEKGMRAGDCETALSSIYYYLEAAFYTGRDLDSIDMDLGNYMNQMEDFKQQKIFRFAEPDLQAIHNLRGKSSNTLVLSGTVMDEDKRMALYNEENDQLMISLLLKNRIFLACFFGEFENGAQMMIEHSDMMFKSLVSQVCTPVLAFTGSLCCFAHARKTRSRFHHKHARKFRRKVKQWAERNPNCVFYIILLNAEKAWLSGRRSAAFELYKNAVTTAGRLGFVHDQALANERLAESYLDEGSTSEGKYRLEQSISSTPSGRPWPKCASCNLVLRGWMARRCKNSTLGEA